MVEGPGRNAPPTPKPYRRQIEATRGFLDVLGPDWDGYTNLWEQVDAFEQDCDKVAAGRGVDAPVIGLAGLKNAGKTTLARWLVNDELVREQLPVGAEHGGATRDVIWIGAREPAHRAHDERFVPCRHDSMADLGLVYCLVDIPGSNERNADLSASATRALSSTLALLLVVDYMNLENDRDLEDYLRHCSDSLVIPVITFAPTDRVDQGTVDVRAYRARLNALLPAAAVTSPILVGDFDARTLDPDTRSREIGEQFVSDLHARLAPLRERHGAEHLREQQLATLHARYLDELAHGARSHLPHLGRFDAELRELESKVPHAALVRVLGSDQELVACLSQKMAANVLEQTPVWTFPWRPLLSGLLLARGAIDRVPLLLAGSAGSLVSIAASATRNVRAGRRANALAEHGLRRFIRERLHTESRLWVRKASQALKQDLGRAADPKNLTLEVEGLDELQRASTDLILETARQYAPTRATCRAYAMFGFLVFWGLFGWPLYDLYHSFLTGIGATIDGALTPFSSLGRGTAAALFNAFLLSLLPMVLCQLLFLAWLLRRGRLRVAAAELRQRHEHRVQQLLAERILRIELDLPEIKACRHLLHARHHGPPHEWGEKDKAKASQPH